MPEFYINKIDNSLQRKAFSFCALALAVSLAAISIASNAFAKDSSHDYDGQPLYVSGDAAVQKACGTAFDTLGQYYKTPTLNDVLNSRDALANATPEGLRQFLTGQESSLSRAHESLCRTLAGGSEASLDGGAILEGLSQQGALSLVGMGTSWARGTGLPFLARLETEAGFRNSDPYWEVLAVQPLWQDESKKNHIFTQVSWNRTYNGEYEAGTDKRDTLNAGLAARRLLDDDRILVGVNAFFDHNMDYDHNRMSVGADIQTALLGASVNRYLPLTEWRNVDALTEERAVAGWDLELRGQVESLPAWTGYIKGYQWDGHDDVSDTYGLDTRLEWAPIRAVRASVGVTKENAGDWDAQMGVRLVYNMGEDIDYHTQAVTELTSVKDRAWDKVWRDNTIRVQQRQKQSTQLRVTATSGINTYSGSSGSGPLSAGLMLNMPVTVMTQNAIGAFAALTFAHGGTLTLGQGTEIAIEPAQVTLITGVMQYVSGSTNITVNIPGGTVALLGTDIDVVTNGTDSTVRVRDGQIRTTGTNGGAITSSPGDGAQILSGVATAIAAGDPEMETHGQTVSDQIDQVAPKRDAAKYAPYPYGTPHIVQSGAIVGDTVKISVGFSKSVTVSGTPRLMFEINGNNRLADYDAADSNDENMVFSYTLVLADAGATDLSLQGIDLNGGGISHGSQEAVTSIANTTLSLSGAIDPGQDDTPDAFSFTNITDADWSEMIMSETVTISDIGPSPVAISIAGSGSPQFRIDGGAWTSAPDTISDGQTLELRLTSAATASVLRSATVTVGTESVQWDVTTANDQCAATAPAIGTQCNNGSYYAGTSPDSGDKFFVMENDAPTAMNWGDAIAYCSNLAPPSAQAHGRSDWYLPSQDEMLYIFNNLGPQPNHNFQPGWYFTSLESSPTDAWAQGMSSGPQWVFGKHELFSVRCARQ